MDASTGLVLYESEGTTPMYPASITKIMTALIVLEHATNLTERIEFCDDSVWGIPRNSSHIYMDVGETLSIYEALYALMLESANEVSVALAIHIAGSVEEFTDLMNRRAASLGAHDTHFVNPSGLPARGHVTTAYDMALIMREAINNPIFTNIISTRRFDIPPTERQTETRHLLNSHQQIRNGAFYNEARNRRKNRLDNRRGKYASDLRRRRFPQINHSGFAGRRKRRVHRHRFTVGFRIRASDGKRDGFRCVNIFRRRSGFSGN
jgi:D-alanyl-D-alanine carboxypeptidase